MHQHVHSIVYNRQLLVNSKLRGAQTLGHLCCGCKAERLYLYFVIPDRRVEDRQSGDPRLVVVDVQERRLYVVESCIVSFASRRELFPESANKYLVVFLDQCLLGCHTAGTVHIADQWIPQECSKRSWTVG